MAITYDDINAAEGVLDELRQEYPDAADVLTALDFDIDAVRQYVVDRDSVEVMVGFLTGYLLAKGLSADDVRGMITADSTV